MYNISKNIPLTRDIVFKHETNYHALFVSPPSRRRVIRSKRNVTDEERGVIEVKRRK